MSCSELNLHACTKVIYIHNEIAKNISSKYNIRASLGYNYNKAYVNQSGCLKSVE